MQFKIGETYSGELISTNEGPSLEFTRDRFNLILQLKGLTESEVRNFQQSRFGFALYAQDGIIFFLMDVPGVIDWSDAPFSVSTFPPESWPPETTNGSGPELKLTVLLVEGETRRIRGVREIRLSEEFSDELLAQINLQRKNLLSAEECLARISKVQKKVPPAKMAEKSSQREERG